MTHTTPAPSPRLLRILLIAPTALLIFLFVVYIAYAVNLIQFPFDYDQGEGFELIDTIMFSQGHLPYQNIDVYPFFSSNYPPLFHVIAAPFVSIFGPAYWYGRLLSFLSSLVAAAAIAYAVYRGSRSRWIALLSGLAFLASNTIYHIGPLFRQHMMMVMFETFAVVVLAEVNEIPDTTRRRRTLALGLLMLLAAGFTKQLAAFTCIAAFAFLFIRQPRRAVIWGVIFALAAGGVFLWLNLATNGEWWRNVIAANINRYNLDQTIGLYRLWFSLHGFLIVPAVLYLLYEVYFARISIYAVWFVVALAVGAASGQWGAGDSYFATAIAAMCILSGLFAARILNKPKPLSSPSVHLITHHSSPRTQNSEPRTQNPESVFRTVNREPGTVNSSENPELRTQNPSSLLPPILPLLYLFYAIAVFHMPTEGAVFGDIARLLNLRPNTNFAFYDSAGRIAGGYADIGHFTTQADIDAGWQIVEIVRSAQGDVMSEDAGFSLMAGRQPVGNPTQLLNLWMNGMLDSSDLIARIEAQAFGVIIFRGQLYPVDILQAIAAHYAPSETITMNGFEYIIMRPR